MGFFCFVFLNIRLLFFKFYIGFFAHQRISNSCTVCLLQRFKNLLLKIFPHTMQIPIKNVQSNDNCSKSSRTYTNVRIWNLFSVPHVRYKVENSYRKKWVKTLFLTKNHILGIFKKSVLDFKDTAFRL